jgi:peptidoglycan/LPS O-acetylase OafA/YrhL
MFKKQTQIESIVLLRGIAALGVCFVHFYLTNGVQYSQLMTQLFFSGQLGVSMFFVISGFVLPYSLSQKIHDKSVSQFSFKKKYPDRSALLGNHRVIIFIRVGTLASGYQPFGFTCFLPDTFI